MCDQFFRFQTELWRVYSAAASSGVLLFEQAQLVLWETLLPSNLDRKGSWENCSQAGAPHCTPSLEAH